MVKLKDENGALLLLAEENNIPLKIVKLETLEQAQACPSPATIFSAFYNGKFLTTDMSLHRVEISKDASQNQTKEHKML